MLAKSIKPGQETKERFVRPDNKNKTKQQHNNNAKVKKKKNNKKEEFVLWPQS